MKRYIILLFTVLTMQSANAIRTTIGGLNYSLIAESHEAIISYGNICTGEVDIPSEVSYNGQTFIVKSMIWNAFYDCPELTKVRIPKTLESVMHYYPNDPDEGDIETILISSDYMNPFVSCAALESVEVDKENPSMKSVVGVLFSKDGTRLYAYPAGARRESYTIPDGVEWIGSEAFEHNQYIPSLTMPSSLKQICSNVFAGCNNLTDIYCYAENVPVAFSSAFKDFPIASATLHVPAGSVEAYKATSPWSGFGNIVAIEDPVTYTVGQMATIILPTSPDAGKGKYYRLDRVEGREIIFEQELQPRAHVPYIIVPSEDFSIDPSTLDLEGLGNDTVSIDGISFIGTYSREELPEKDGFYIDIIDTTPDCGLSLSGETGRGAVVGALRAWLQVTWNDPYNQGGTKAPGEKLQIVLKDKGTSIESPREEMVNGKSSNGKCFDLGGRRLPGRPKSGLYIEGDRKTAR